MRYLNKKECDLILYMLKDKPIAKHLISNLTSKLVEQMNDGGMGSLRFINNDNKKDRKFGKEVAMISLLDIDGIPVSFTINFDDDNNIFELDIFKSDFSPLKKFPVPPYDILPPPLVL